MLNKDVEHINCPGYCVVARRDRSVDQNRGGIITLCRASLFPYIVHVHTSTCAERMWHYLTLDVGIVVLCNWHRPPGSDDDIIQTFRDEFQQFAADTQFHIVCGDLNIHHIPWLHFSNAATASGDMMWNIASEFHLQQRVTQPIHNDYLLDF